MSFTAWVQKRLNHHGAKLSVDGAWGPLTKRALIAFQGRKKIPRTGTANTKTVKALRSSAKNSPAEAPIPTPAQRMPVWMEEMARRSGLHEVRNNKTLSNWLRSGSYLGNPANLPWCGDAVETCFARTLTDEPLPSNPFWARNWATFGKKLTAPAVGAVGVIGWKKGGHVGFVTNWNNTHVWLLGGNQQNAINIRRFPRKVFIAFTWPKTVPVETYPRIKGSAIDAGFSGTR